MSVCLFVEIEKYIDFLNMLKGSLLCRHNGACQLKVKHHKIIYNNKNNEVLNHLGILTNFCIALNKRQSILIQTSNRKIGCNRRYNDPTIPNQAPFQTSSSVCSIFHTHAYEITLPSLTQVLSYMLLAESESGAVGNHQPGW